jgi:hypothetical protein
VVVLMVDVVAGAPTLPMLSDSGRAEQQPGHRHPGLFAVEAVALLRGGAADFRIVGREQQSPDSDEIAGRRPLRAPALGSLAPLLLDVVAEAAAFARPDAVLAGPRGLD